MQPPLTPIPVYGLFHWVGVDVIQLLKFHARLTSVSFSGQVGKLLERNKHPDHYSRQHGTLLTGKRI